MTLRALLALLPDATSPASASVLRRVVRGFSTDSRAVEKGQVFVALRGEHFDGHAFVDAAAARGAVAAIVSRAWGEVARTSLPLVIVEDTLAAYGAIARAHRASFEIPVVAVGGSNGKTTTKDLIAHLLGGSQTVLATEGNLNNLIGVPATLLRLRPEHTVAVVEIGTNTPGEIAQLCTIVQPTHGIITSIGREHLELLGSIEGVAREEGALFEWLAGHKGRGFVNLDDRHVARLGKDLKRSTTYGRGEKAQVRVKIVSTDRFGAPCIALTTRMGRGTATVTTQLAMPGRHAAGNAAAAASVALTLGVPLAEVGARLGTFRPAVSGSGYARLAPMTGAVGEAILNDTYNANPDSVIAALKTLGSIRPGRGGRRIAVLGDMLELGRGAAEEHRAIGREIVAGGRVHIALFHGPLMRHAHHVVYNSARRGETATRSFHFAEREGMIEAVLALAAPEDVILVKGSRGMRMELAVTALCDPTARQEIG